MYQHVNNPSRLACSLSIDSIVIDPIVRTSNTLYFAHGAVIYDFPVELRGLYFRVLLLYIELLHHGGSRRIKARDRCGLESREPQAHTPGSPAGPRACGGGCARDAGWAGTTTSACP